MAVIKPPTKASPAGCFKRYAKVLCPCICLTILSIRLSFFNVSSTPERASISNRGKAWLWHNRTASTLSHPLFSFYLMGDIPYSTWEEDMLQVQIRNISLHRPAHALFTVHVGDLQKAHRTQCERSYYKKIQRILRKNALPTVMLPGDNDWYDCKNRAQAWGFYQEHFNQLERYWYDDKNRSAKLSVPKLDFHRWEDHQEYFVMEHEGILFVSVHLIHGNPKHEAKGVFEQRTQSGISWVKQNVRDYVHNPTLIIRGVVLLGHSLRSPWTRPFFEGVAEEFLADEYMESIPVLYLHGDGHDWEIDSKLNHQLHWGNFHDVQIDAGGFADPCLVEIAPQNEGELVPLRKEHDLQYVFGKGLFRIDRQQGLYPMAKTAGAKSKH